MKVQWSEGIERLAAAVVQGGCNQLVVGVLSGNLVNSATPGRFSDEIIRVGTHDMFETSQYPAPSHIYIVLMID